MTKKNMLSVLEKLINENHFQCEWGIEWNEQNHYIELIFQLSLSNPQGLPLKDSNEMQLEDKELPYEIRVIIYDENRAVITPHLYIHCLPIPESGEIEYGELVTLVKYLKHLTSGVKLQWTEFYQENNLDYFEVSWDENEFEQLKKSLKETYRYNQEKVFFPIK